jgi:hypothetical protein
MKTGIDLKQLKQYLEKNYGKKCRTYSFGCITCQVWRAYEDLEELLEIESNEQTKTL